MAVKTALVLGTNGRPQRLQSGDSLPESVGRFPVVAYGATGNGTTDDTTAIQAAITAAGNAGGGTVQLAGGHTHRLTSTLSITKPYVRIRGGGMSSTKLIKDFTTGDLFSAIPATIPTDADGVGLPGLAFEDFWIDGNVTPHTAGRAIYAQYTKDCLIRRVRIGTQESTQGTGTSGSLLLYDGIYLDLQSCCVIEACDLFVQHRGIGLTGSGPLTGMALPLGTSQFPYFGYDGVIHGCVLYNKYTAGSIGIHLGGGTGGVRIVDTDVGLWEIGLLVDTALRIETNREVMLGPGLFLDSCGNRGFQVGASSATVIQWVDVWAAGAGRETGFTGGYPNGNGINIDQPNAGLKVILSGGRIYSCTGGGIQASAGRLSVTGLQIHDNGSGSGGGNGIDVLGGTLMDGVEITGCQIANNGNATQGTGIKIAASTSNFVVSGNVVENNAAGQIAIATGCDHYTVSGNTLAGVSLLTNTPGIGLTRIVRSNSGVTDDVSAGSSGLTIGTTAITSGTTGTLLYDSGGTLAEATVGTGLAFSTGVLSATGGSGSGTTGTNGQSVLAADFLLTTTGTYQDTGLSVSLPSAGTYWIAANLRVILQVANPDGYISIKLHDATNAVDIANTVRLCFYTQQTDLKQLESAYSFLVTVTGAITLSLYSGRFGSTTSWTYAQIGSNADGYTTLAYVKLA